VSCQFPNNPSDNTFNFPENGGRILLRNVTVCQNIRRHTVTVYSLNIPRPLILQILENITPLLVTFIPLIAKISSFTEERIQINDILGKVRLNFLTNTSTAICDIYNTKSCD